MIFHTLSINDTVTTHHIVTFVEKNGTGAGACANGFFVTCDLQFRVLKKS